MSATFDPRPIREVIGMVIADARQLMRGELALARTELKSKATSAVMGIVWLVVALVFGLAALMILMLAAVAALSIVLPGWAASLVVAVIVLVIAAIAARSGMAMLSPSNLMPQRTTQGLAKDAQLVTNRNTNDVIARNRRTTEGQI